MTQEQENKKSNKLLIIILILLLILIIFFIWWFLNKDNTENKNVNIANINGEVKNYEPDNEWGIQLPLAREEVLALSETKFSNWVVKDDNGLIYYADNTNEKKVIKVYDTEGAIHDRWESNSGEVDINIEIAGQDEDGIIFIFTDKQEPMTCAELWSGDYVYYGIGYGVKNYSGAGGLLLENNEELLQTMQDKCAK